MTARKTNASSTIIVVFFCFVFWTLMFYMISPKDPCQGISGVKDIKSLIDSIDQNESTFSSLLANSYNSDGGYESWGYGRQKDWDEDIKRVESRRNRLSACVDFAAEQKKKNLKVDFGK